MLTLCDGAAAGNEGRFSYIQPNADIRTIHIYGKRLIGCERIGFVRGQANNILIVVATANAGDIDHGSAGVNRSICVGIEHIIHFQCVLTQLRAGRNHDLMLTHRDGTAAGNEGSCRRIQPNADIRAIHIYGKRLSVCERIGFVGIQVNNILTVVATANTGDVDHGRFVVYLTVCVGIEHIVAGQFAITQHRAGRNHDLMLTHWDGAAAGNEGRFSYIQPNADIRAIHIYGKRLSVCERIGFVGIKVNNILIIIGTANTGNVQGGNIVCIAGSMGIEHIFIFQNIIAHLHTRRQNDLMFCLVRIQIKRQSAGTRLEPTGSGYAVNGHAGSFCRCCCRQIEFCIVGIENKVPVGVSRTVLIRFDAGNIESCRTYRAISIGTEHIVLSQNTITQLRSGRNHNFMITHWDGAAAGNEGSCRRIQPNADIRAIHIYGKRLSVCERIGFVGIQVNNILTIIGTANTGDANAGPYIAVSLSEEHIVFLQRVAAHHHTGRKDHFVISLVCIQIKRQSAGARLEPTGSGYTVNGHAGSFCRCCCRQIELCIVGIENNVPVGVSRTVGIILDAGNGELC